MTEKESNKLESEVTIADLYPDLSPAEQAEAEYRMLRYLEVVKEIFEQIVQEKPEILTKLELMAMLRKKERQ